MKQNDLGEYEKNEREKHNIQGKNTNSPLNQGKSNQASNLTKDVDSP